MNDPYVLPEVCFGLGIIVVAWHYGFERLRQDEFRCNLRRIRDELFDFMWQNRMDFQDPAYQEARDSLNAMIYTGGVWSPLVIIVAGILVLNRDPIGKAIKPAQRVCDSKLQAAIDLAKSKTVEVLRSFLFQQGVRGWLTSALLLCSRAIYADKRAGEISKAGTNYVISNAKDLVRCG